ncbi:MAG: SufD family Fe-S cluster assembly protein [Clostridia bacterium]|nr:SufD family Fe-S cluster assembly protein [Clostridia bacterium]
MDAIEKTLLQTVADLHEVPEGAYNIRENGKSVARSSSANIEIVTKTEAGKPGIDIIIQPHTKNESVHIPVILSQSGLKETVYNDFYIGEGAEVLIVAVCGIHNCGGQDSEPSGIHTFHVGKNAKVKYVEKHYAQGEGTGEKIMNPTTEVYVEEGGSIEMETTQIKGVDSTHRITRAKLKKNASLVVREKIYTHGKQIATTDFSVDLDGENSSADLVSRSVATENSHQGFNAVINGNTKCTGHSECDAIIMDNGTVTALPALTANNVDAALIHEAAIGKIAGEQLIKLMTLGLSEQEAEEQIIQGFLK